MVSMTRSFVHWRWGDSSEDNN